MIDPAETGEGIFSILSKEEKIPFLYLRENAVMLVKFEVLVYNRQWQISCFC